MCRRFGPPGGIALSKTQRFPLLCGAWEDSVRVTTRDPAAGSSEKSRGSRPSAPSGQDVELPVVMVYMFLQRQFIRGMLSGALKG